MLCNKKYIKVNQFYDKIEMLLLNIFKTTHVKNVKQTQNAKTKTTHKT